jgi:hypothetical protein
MAFPKPVEVVRTFEDACNARDVEAVLACFNGDAALSVHCAGLPQIRAWVEAVLPGFHAESRDHSVAGHTVTWIGAVSSVALRQLGFYVPVELAIQAVIRDGRIAHVTVTPAPSAAVTAHQDGVGPEGGDSVRVTVDAHAGGHSQVDAKQLARMRQGRPAERSPKG